MSLIVVGLWAFFMIAAFILAAKILHDNKEDNKGIGYKFTHGFTKDDLPKTNDLWIFDDEFEEFMKELEMWENASIQDQEEFLRDLEN